MSSKYGSPTPTLGATSVECVRPVNTDMRHAAMTEELGVVRSDLARDLDRLREADIPVDVAFRQGEGVLGL